MKVCDLPAGRNHHWTKSLVANKAGTRLYVGVGSNSNVAEFGMQEEVNRANILEVDIATGAVRVFAGGLRNPVGMDWNPVTGELWTAVNERDEIGDDLVPDYMTSVKDGAFYGWPYCYYDKIVDERVQPQRPDLVASSLKPDYALGSHTASLGLTFVDDERFGARFKDGVFIGQHGSWNRNPPSGYRVIFIPFRDGAPPAARRKSSAASASTARRSAARSACWSTSAAAFWWSTMSATASGASRRTRQREAALDADVIEEALVMADHEQGAVIGEQPLSRRPRRIPRRDDWSARRG